MIDLNNYIGKQFSPNARGPDEYDCWGLVSEILEKEKGYKLPVWFVPDYTDMGAQKTLSRGLKDCLNKEYAVRVDEPQDFDIAMLTRKKLAYHIGLYIGTKVLHVSKTTSGVVYQNINDFTRNAGELRFYRWVA